MTDVGRQRHWLRHRRCRRERSARQDDCMKRSSRSLVIDWADTPHDTDEKSDRGGKRERGTSEDQARGRQPSRCVRPTPPEPHRQQIVGGRTRCAIGLVIFSVPPESIQFLGFILSGRRQPFYLLLTL